MKLRGVGSPSTSHIWGSGGCTAYPLVCADSPSSDMSSNAEEGIMAHAAAEKLLTTGEATDIADPELESAVMGYVTYCAGLMGSATSFGIEQRVNVARVHNQSNGVVDFWAYDAKTRTLEIVDFKSGFNYVDAAGNSQLMMYASALIDSLELDDLTTALKLTIVQPRAMGGDPIRSESIMGHMIRGPINSLRFNAVASMSAETAFRSPGSHCRRCPGLATCDAAALLAGRLYDDAIAYSPSDTTPDQLGRRLEDIGAAAKFLEQLASAIREDVKTRISSGVAVTGWELKPFAARLEWVIDKPEETIDLFGVDIRKPLEVKTPTQVAAELKRAGLPAELLNGIAKRGPSYLTLKKVNLSHYKKVFNHGTN